MSTTPPGGTDEFYDYVLAHAPEYVRDMREADARYERGESDSRPLSEVLADLDASAAGLPTD